MSCRTLSAARSGYPVNLGRISRSGLSRVRASDLPSYGQLSCGPGLVRDSGSGELVFYRGMQSDRNGSTCSLTVPRAMQHAEFVAMVAVLIVVDIQQAIRA